MWPFGRNLSTGRRGEKLAAKFLRRKGLKILATNYRCPEGEVDLIALDEIRRDGEPLETIVFVEVKTRSSSAWSDPESAVGQDKQMRIRKVASYYLRARNAIAYDIRFDIVSVLIGPRESPQIRHIIDAF